MNSLMARKLGLATVCLLCNSLWGCGGGGGGARYTVDGTVFFAQGVVPRDDITLSVASTWSYDTSTVEPPFADDEGDTRPGFGSVLLGPWTPTAQPDVYAFSVVVDVETPAEASEPLSVDPYITTAEPAPIFFAYGTGVSQQIGVERDGWIPIEVHAAFDTTSWW
jgi:hypothetical protein